MRPAIHSAYSLPAHRSWLLHSFLVFTFLVGPLAMAKGQNSTADEDEIRAAMVFNLTKFIDWPSWKLDATHPHFLICTLGSDPIGPALDRYNRNQNAGGKPVQLRHLSSLDGAATCNILYVSASERKDVDRALPELMKSGVLTVSERPNAINPNQVIGLPSVEDHVRIDVNLGAAQRTGVTVSSKLLRLATVSH